MRKVFCLKLLGRLFYVVAVIYAVAFIASVIGSKARFDLLLATFFLVFLGLLGEVVGDVARKVLQSD